MWGEGHLDLQLLRHLHEATWRVCGRTWHWQDLALAQPGAGMTWRWHDLLVVAVVAKPKENLKITPKGGLRYVFGWNPSFCVKEKYSPNNSWTMDVIVP